jgi:hypothetical protein
VLVASAAGGLYLAARRLFRQGMALARELGDVADTLADVSPAGSSSPRPEPAPALSGSQARALAKGRRSRP